MTKDIKKAILYFFKFPESHPTADELYASLKEKIGAVAKKEFFAALEFLERKNQIKTALSINDEKRYHIRTEQHFHFICSECGGVRDLVISNGALEMIKDHAQIQINSSGKIKTINLSFQGLCHECLNNK